MYIVLGVLYESFIHPITILSTLPSAGIGALLALMLAGAGLDIIGVIGIVLLIGIVKKNAIMMIDFALEAQRERGPAAARGDLSGLPAAPAADPDDDGRGDVRRAAADARHRRRLRAAPSARPRDRRRPGLQPGADALTRRRSSISSSSGSASASASAPPTGASRREGAVNNRFSALFIRRPVATTLLTIGVVAGRRCSAIRSCRSRRCRRSISRSSPCRPTCPAPARTRWRRRSPRRSSAISDRSPTSTK